MFQESSTTFQSSLLFLPNKANNVGPQMQLKLIHLYTLVPGLLV